jgi:hypothetical protein
MEILGFKISKAKRFGLDSDEGKDQIPSFVAPIDDSGASPVSNGGGYYGSYLDFDGTAKSELELIARYRDAALYPDTDNAIEEICNEAIGAEDDETVVKIFLDDVDQSKAVKLKIEAAFEEVKQLLDFEAKAHDIFKRWYIDGRVYYHKMTDPKSPQKGIQELRYIDPRKIKKIREITKSKDVGTGIEVISKIKDYFLYAERPMQKQTGYASQLFNVNGVKIDPEAICYVTSGLIDLERNMVLGHLHKAVKPINMLKLAEDAMLIFRLSRAPSRRVFYIDVGNLPKQKAEQYLKDTMQRYRNKIVYDASTGEIQDDRKHMSMLEDYWLPRREGGRGTQIENLEGITNTNQKEEVEYYLNRVYSTMNVPMSRLTQGTTMNFGKQAEITQDELKFAKFIARLRRKFSEIFGDLLRTQAVLTGICSVEDWDELIKPFIKYNFAQDIYWKEAKELEVFRSRIELLTSIQPFVGTYYSKEFVKKNILKQTDDEIDEMQQEMAGEQEEQVRDAQFKGQIDGAQQAATMEMLPQEPTAAPAKKK